MHGSNRKSEQLSKLIKVVLLFSATASTMTATSVADVAVAAAATSTKPATSSSLTAAASASAFSSYVFGYGSLLCPKSRVVTAPTMAGRKATPVKIKHLQRQWSMPVGGWTAMGIIHQPDAECVGVLVPVNDQELAQLDIRETGYTRVPILPEHIEKIDFLNDMSHQEEQQQQQRQHYHHEHCYFGNGNTAAPLSVTTSSLSQSPNIWVYVQENPVPISPENPICQSYVDIMMRGCLSIAPEFAHQFLQTTKGWSSSQQQEGDHTIFWVNDRHDPLYPRADVEYSQTHGPVIVDELLETFRPVEFKYRRHYFGRSSTF